jgi:predicted amidophosphoribosyltransferase
MAASYTERRAFKRVILIDDAVGSGSTLNQIAERSKKKRSLRKLPALR